MIVVNEIHDFEEIPPQVQHFTVSESQIGQIFIIEGLSFFVFLTKLVYLGKRNARCVLAERDPGTNGGMLQH